LLASAPKLADDIEATEPATEEQFI